MSNKINDSHQRLDERSNTEKPTKRHSMDPAKVDFDKIGLLSHVKSLVT